MKRVLVAVPALDEQATIGLVIAEVRAEAPWADVLVVDDASTDATAAIAAGAGARVIRHPFNMGVGGAMRTAFLFAQRQGYDALVQVDGDGQHVAAHIADLVDALTAASVAVGSRFSGESSTAERGPRRWTMRMLAAALSRICAAPLTDTTSGFRAADREAIALFATHYPSEYLGDTVESLVLASRAGLVIREVPVSMRPRQGGAASQTPARAGMYLVRALLALAVAMGRRPPSPASAGWDVDMRRPNEAQAPAGRPAT